MMGNPSTVQATHQRTTMTVEGVPPIKQTHQLEPLEEVEATDPLAKRARN
jgi:hypothetical protein